MGKKYILAIDQGTTSTRAIIFDQKLQPMATAQEEFAQYFPKSGWVEHDPEDLWLTTVAMCSRHVSARMWIPLILLLSASLTSVKRRLFGTGILDELYTMPLFGRIAAQLIIVDS